MLLSPPQGAVFIYFTRQHFREKTIICLVHVHNISFWTYKEQIGRRLHGKTSPCVHQAKNRLQRRLF